MARLIATYTLTTNQTAAQRKIINMNKILLLILILILIIMISMLLSGCVVEGEVYPWYDTEGNGGVTNEVKL
jgi:hypothetical protein